MTPNDRDTITDYFDRREYDGPSGLWIVPVLIVGVSVYGSLLAWVLS